MTIAIWVVGAYCILATAAHIGSILIVTRRCRKRRPVSVRSGGKTALGVLGLTRFLRRRGLHYGKERLGGAAGAALDIPGVSLVRPVCGLENHIEDTLRSAFDLDYPRYEIIFCAAAANDSALPLVRRLIADQPHVPARLLIGNDSISENPKLNNVCKGWSAAAYDRIVMADSNVLMPRDYVERLLAAWRADTGVVTSPPVGCRPQGFCGTRMRLPQYLSGALAVCRRRVRLRLCAGQVDALPA
jgi:cellulose synthase/poly-beta-1,6-N-acetylglucosamine synthase-like glycosyltransferase